MKIIIQDYTTNHCSQSRLLFSELQKYDNIQPFFWSDQERMSAYDFMDTTQPDFLIINAIRTNKELVHYLSTNETDKKIILKIPEGTDAQHFDMIASSEFVHKHVMMTISEKEIPNIRNVNLKPCVDNNIPDIAMRSRIPLCFITNTGEISSDLLSLSPSFHVISHTKEDGVDLSGPHIHTCGLYKNYDKIIFHNIEKFEQPFFDAAYRTKTFFTSDDSSLSEKSIALFGQDLNIKNSEVDFNKVKQHLEEKHMPQNRVKQLLSQMPIDQSIFTKVEK